MSIDKLWIDASDKLKQKYENVVERISWNGCWIDMGKLPENVEEIRILIADALEICRKSGIDDIKVAEATPVFFKYANGKQGVASWIRLISQKYS